MIEYLLVAGAIWLGLVLFEPVIVYWDTIKSCDIKYSADRAHRAEIYAQLDAIHRQSPTFKQMEAEKKRHKHRKEGVGNARARRNARRKVLQEAYAEQHKEEYGKNN